MSKCTSLKRLRFQRIYFQIKISIHTPAKLLVVIPIIFISLVMYFGVCSAGELVLGLNDTVKYSL